MKPSPARIRAAEQRQSDRATATLHRMTEWPAGMPPVSAVGSGVGILTLLERRGLARCIGRDGLGDPRFVLTAKGRREIDRPHG